MRWDRPFKLLVPVVLLLILDSPKVESSSWVEQQEILASDGMPEDHFGEAVAIDQDTMVVGSHFDDTASIEDHGSAYVYTRSSGVWTEVQKLVASDAQDGDWFGEAVAIQGDTVVVGAKFDDNEGAYGNGGAYIFERNGDTWSETQKLVVENSQTSDRFGESVAIDGNSLIVGEIDGNDDKGAAYVYVKSGGNWTLEAQLVAANGAEDDSFGRSVGISGDLAVVGAPGKFYGDYTIPGYAVVFQRTGSSWDGGFELLADDGELEDKFGHSVSIDGTTVIVGNRRIGYREASYVFEQTGATNNWTQTQKLDAMGYAVAIDGNHLLSDRTVFERASNGTWTKQEELLSSRFSSRLAFSVDISGATVAVGSWGDSNNTGVVHVFVDNATIPTPPPPTEAPLETPFPVPTVAPTTLPPTEAPSETSFPVPTVAPTTLPPTEAPSETPLPVPTVAPTTLPPAQEDLWFEEQKLVADDGQERDFFSYSSVAIDNDIAVIGAVYDDDLGSESGSVYIFVRDSNSGSWNMQQKLTSSDGNWYDYFGSAVDVSGDTIVVGAPGADQSLGAAYVFVRSDDGIWTETQKLSAPVSVGYFGASVAVDADTIVVGNSPLFDYSSAFVFTRSGLVWSHQQTLETLRNAVDAGDGIPVDTDQSTIVVGGADAASVYQRSGDSWGSAFSITASGAADGWNFGSAVAVKGDTIIVADEDENSGKGAIYVFVPTDQDTNSWAQQQRLIASDGLPYDKFGSSVSFDGASIIIGAEGKEQAYVFVLDGSSWVERDILIASDGVSGDAFGEAVGVSGDAAVVGSPYSNGYTGSVYAFASASASE